MLQVCTILSVNSVFAASFEKGDSFMAMRIETNPLEAAYAVLLENGFDGAGEALRIMVNEAARIERAGRCCRPFLAALTVPSAAKRRSIRHPAGGEKKPSLRTAYACALPTAWNASTAMRGRTRLAQHLLQPRCLSASGLGIARRTRRRIRPTRSISTSTRNPKVMTTASEIYRKGVAQSRTSARFKNCSAIAMYRRR